MVRCNLHVQHATCCTYEWKWNDRVGARVGGSLDHVFKENVTVSLTIGVWRLCPIALFHRIVQAVILSHRFHII